MLSKVLFLLFLIAPTRPQIRSEYLDYGRPPAPPIDCADLECSSDAFCLSCKFPANCKYWHDVNVTCEPATKCREFLEKFAPQKVRSEKRQTHCRFCYQIDENEQICQEMRNCSVSASPHKRMVHTYCTAKPHVICMGQRTFHKMVRCHFKSGYKWSTAFILSLTLGGFGADRFYLGLWKSGVGKLFSFGGLGIWTLIDVILIGTGYIGPGDGSMYE